ncbi:MAG: DUF4296 domain-containing protein [Rikenellaceae bacterium]
MNKVFSRYFTQFSVAIFLFAAMLFAGSCNRVKQLSDDELAMVFHDAFLANSYTLSIGLQLDSLKLYEPIFQKYGYSVEDVQHTIGSFSKRKSAKLSDVVERAITMLEEEGKRLDREVAILDTVVNIATRRAARVVLAKDHFKMQSMRDTSKYKFVINDVAAGRYRIEFDYLVDSVDTNKKSYLTQSWSEKDGDIRRFNRNNATLNRNVSGGHTSVIQIDQDKDRIVIAPVVPQASASRMSVQVKNLRVTYLPTQEQGRDMIYDRLLDVTIFNNEIATTEQYEAENSI